MYCIQGCDTVFVTPTGRTIDLVTAWYMVWLSSFKQLPLIACVYVDAMLFTFLCISAEKINHPDDISEHATSHTTTS